MNLVSSEIYGKCGIMTACLVDPLSQLINKIHGMKENDVNSVGIYYHSSEQGVTKCNVILFNMYDNDPIPWLRLGYTMDLLLGSPFVIKVVYYPLNFGDEKTTILSRNASVLKNIKKLEDTFRANLIHVITLNAKSIHDKNVSYTAMLLKLFGVITEDADKLINSIITGYTLVNRILLAMMGIEKIDTSKISSSIIPCPLLKQPITITAPKEVTPEDDVKYIVEQSRREITKLTSVFVDLYTSDKDFRSVILSFKTRSSNHSNDQLFNRETELVSHVVTALQNGVFCNETLNEAIRELNGERFNLGNYQPLPLSIKPQKQIEISQGSTLCTFQHTITLQNTDPLRDLGDYLKYLVECFTSDSPLIFNLGGMINAYNKVIMGCDLEKIDIPKMGGNHSVSKSAVITMPSDATTENIKIPLKPKTIEISMFNPNLTTLSEIQLKDILIYIDSLRSNDGSYDTRFVNLQNEVTHELGKRRNKK